MQGLGNQSLWQSLNSFTPECCFQTKREIEETANGRKKKKKPRATDGEEEEEEETDSKKNPKKKKGRFMKKKSFLRFFDKN